MNIQFGTKQASEVIDANGSTKTVKEDYRDGEAKKPIRVEYKLRSRVTSADEERQAYLDFSKLLEYDPALLDPAFLIEHSVAGKKGGYYYVVRCYTRLEY